MPEKLTRRDTFRIGGAVALLGLGWPAIRAARAADEPAAGASRKRLLRIAHLTDAHIQPERKGYEGVAACLKHIMAQKDRPEFVLTGGDLIMDAFGADEARTKLQWDLWLKVLQDECPLPIHHCLGNHDIWGWNKEASKTTGSEPMWGKRWACDLLKLERPYYAFERGGWKFIVLDSVQPFEDGYEGRIDDEQFEWLSAEIERTPKTTNILLLSHIPILCASMIVIDSQPLAEGGYRIGRGLQITDFRRLIDLFSKHPNVRTALAGHIHTVDRIDYNGVSYVCGGAVCGAWWRGREAYLREQQKNAKPGDPPKAPRADEGYNLIDLYDDGRVEREYVTYGWKAAE